MMTMKDATERFKPATAVERELLADCVQSACKHSCNVADVLADAERWWSRAGKVHHPRQWRSRVTAAQRLLARDTMTA